MKRFVVAFLLVFSISSFFSGRSLGATLSPVYVNCNTDTVGPPARISGQTGDTLNVIVTGTCAYYSESRGYSGIATSVPAFGTTLNNTISTITLATAGTGLVYVYDRETPYPLHGKSFYLDVTNPPSVTLSGSVVGANGSVDVIYFTDYGDDRQYTNGPYSKAVLPGSDIQAAVMDWINVCDAVNADNLQNNITRNINCRFYSPPIYEYGSVYLKRRASGGQLARINDVTTIDPIFPNHPITYTANCVSSDGGVPANGSVSSNDWNAEARIPLPLTQGSTYTCTGNASAAGYTSQPYSTGPFVPTPTPSPAPIPTLSEWAKISMVFMMILTVGWYGRRLNQR